MYKFKRYTSIIYLHNLHKCAKTVGLFCPKNTGLYEILIE